jgi:hypothetical protein
MWSTLYSCQTLTKPEFYRKFFEKRSNIKFHANPSSGSRVIPWGQTDGEELRTDRHDEANSSFSQFCESAQNRVSISGVLTKNRTDHFPDTSQKALPPAPTCSLPMYPPAQYCLHLHTAVTAEWYTKGSALRFRTSYTEMYYQPTDQIFCFKLKRFYPPTSTSILLLSDFKEVSSPKQGMALPTRLSHRTSQMSELRITGMRSTEHDIRTNKNVTNNLNYDVSCMHISLSA